MLEFLSCILGLVALECDPFQRAVPCWQPHTTDAHLDAYYKLRHAMEYVNRSRPFLEYLPVERLLLPLVNELRQPFVDAGIFRR